MAYENHEKKVDSVYSKRIKAGKRRTYFFDVRETRGSDYFLTITESRKRFNDDGYDRHKIFLYKEDFNKFLKGLNEAVEYVKTELMPNFDFDSFNHDTEEVYDGEVGSTGNGHQQVTSMPSNGLGDAIDDNAIPVINITQHQNGNGQSLDDVDKW